MKMSETEKWNFVCSACGKKQWVPKKIADGRDYAFFRCNCGYEVGLPPQSLQGKVIE